MQENECKFWLKLLKKAALACAAFLSKPVWFIYGL